MMDLSEWQQWNYMAQGQKMSDTEPQDNSPTLLSSSAL
jgi:hypothetical protein